MRRIYVDTGGLTCPKKGARRFVAALRRAIQRAGLEGQVQVLERGCFGLCSIAPNLYVEPDGIWYSRFTLRDVPVIIRQHLQNNRPVRRLILEPSGPQPAVPASQPSARCRRR